MKYKSDHSFVVLAYQESPYLETCIRSLKRQTIASDIIISTSTPNAHIMNIAEAYDLPVVVAKDEERGIAADWNRAISAAKTNLVTLAHQDDVYSSYYAEQIVEAISKSKRPLIAFSDYAELRETDHGYETVTDNKLLQIKRAMLLPLVPKTAWGSRMIRRRVLALGNPICCPAVTFVKSALPQPIFCNNMKSNIDWQAWEEISRLKGDFIYVTKPLMKHRIHQESTTSQLIEEDGRGEEDLQILEKFWPKAVAGMVGKVYKQGEKSNHT